VSTSNPNTTIPAEPGTLEDLLEDLLDVNGDPGPDPTLPPHVATFLGEQLQAFYAHLMNEPVPDRLVQLLDQLGRKETGRDGK
jgi:hypothetical protein